MKDEDPAKINKEKIETVKQMFAKDTASISKTDDLTTKDSETIIKRFFTETSIAIISNIISIAINIPVLDCVLRRNNNGIEVLTVLLGWPLIIALILSFTFSNKTLKDIDKLKKTNMVNNKISKRYKITMLTFAINLLFIILVILSFCLGRPRALNTK